MSKCRVFRIGVPNPLIEGMTNVYGILSSTLTLVDTGVNTSSAMDAVTAGLKKEALAIEDIDQIILTHKHPDHCGLARALQERSGAKIFVHEDDYQDVCHLEERSTRFVQRLEQRLRGWGTPDLKVRIVCALMRQVATLAESVPAYPLRDAEILQLGCVDFQVLHAPGHTRGSICLSSEEYIFTGDHLLAGYTPDIGAGEVDSENMLLQYLNSLHRLQRLVRKNTQVLPGHGEPVKDAASRIGQTVKHHENRMTSLLQMMSDGAPRTVYQLTEEFFGPLESYQIALSTSEVYSHLEMAQEYGLIEQSEGNWQLC